MSAAFDYNEYDSISLALKKEESHRMLSYYRAFGWDEYERREDMRYFDIVHIKLMRRHKIPNKDRLQLLQVKMEALVNNFARVRKNKHSHSLLLGVGMGVLCVSLIALGSVLIFRKLLLSLALSFISLGAVIPFFTVAAVKRILISENKRYAEKFKEMTAGISRIIAEAKKLYSAEVENDEKE